MLHESKLNLESVMPLQRDACGVIPSDVDGLVKTSHYTVQYWGWILLLLIYYLVL